MRRINLRKWATSSVAAIWPNLFRWTHWPIVARRRSTGLGLVQLGRDMYLESRESPTTIWRLDPIIAALISNGIMGELIRQLPMFNASGTNISSGDHRNGGKLLGQNDSESLNQHQVALNNASASWATPPSSSNQGETPSIAPTPTGASTSSEANGGNAAPIGPLAQSWAWENDQFVSSLEPVLNGDLLLDDPLGSGTSQTGGSSSSTDEDGLSLLAGAWLGTGNDSSGSSSGGISSGLESSGPIFSGGNGLTDAGSVLPPGALEGGNRMSVSPLQTVSSSPTLPILPSHPITLSSPPLVSSPPTGQAPAPQVTWSSPVLKSVWRFGPKDNGRLLIQGSVQNTAPLGMNVTLDFYAKDPVAGNTWLLGSHDVMQTIAGSIDFRVDLDADPAPGTWICAEVHGRPDSSGVMPGAASLTDADWTQGGMQLPGGANDPPIPGRSRLDHVAVPVGNGESITIDSPGHPLDDIQMFHPPGLDQALPMGLIGFAVTNVPVGGHAIVRITFPDGMNPTTYFRHDPNSGLLAPFMFDGKEGAQSHGNVVLLHLVDGGQGDADGVANGVIVDPDGPGTSSLPWPNVAIMPAATTGELVTL